MSNNIDIERAKTDLVYFCEAVGIKLNKWQIALIKFKEKYDKDGELTVIHGRKRDCWTVQPKKESIPN